MAWQDRAVANSAAVTRTKQRSIERARAIIDATRHMTIEAREGHTVEQLAKMAGVSLQTFYRYFPSKDELLLALLEDTVRESVEEMREGATRFEHAVDRLRFVVTAPLLVALVPGRSEFVARQHYRLAEQFPDQVEAIVRLYIDLVAEFLAAAIDTGEVAPIDVGDASRCVGLLVLGQFHHCALGMFVGDLSREAEQMWSFCARSLGIDAIEVQGVA